MRDVAKKVWRGEKEQGTKQHQWYKWKKKKLFSFGDSETCSNKPTQQGALPLHNERRGTLTARPWCWSAEPGGGTADGTEWRPAAGGSRSARAPRPACRQPGWFSCGPWRTWPPGTDSLPPAEERRGRERLNVWWFTYLNLCSGVRGR